jgi:hypothetical protein
MSAFYPLSAAIDSAAQWSFPKERNFNPQDSPVREG